MNQEELEEEFINAIEYNNIDKILELIDRVDINKEIYYNDSSWWYPIELACRFNKIEIIEILIEYNVNLNINCFNKKIYPLYKTCFNINNKTIKIILDKNCLISKQILNRFKNELVIDKIKEYILCVKEN